MVKFNREDLARKIDSIIELLIYGFVLSVPFSKTLIEVSFCVMLGLWVIKRSLVPGQRNGGGLIKTLIYRYKPVKTAINMQIALFVAAGFISMLMSVSFSLSLEGFFFKLFEWVMIYFIVAETIGRRDRLKRAFGVMLFSVFVITLDGLFQFFTGTDFIRLYRMRGFRIQASFGNINSFAGWLVIMAPLILSFAVFGRLKARPRIIIWSAAALAVLCLILTYTRGAWIAFILSLTLLGILKKNKRLFLYLALLIIIIPFVIPAVMHERMLSIPGSDAKFKINRLYVWQEALSIVEDFPLFGSGLNTYSTVAPGYKVFEGGGYYPHNSYLHMAAEAGLLGLGALIWMLLVLFKTSLLNLKVIIEDPFYATFLTALLTGLFAFLVHSFVDTNFYSLQLGNFMWYIIGLIAAIQRAAMKDGGL